MITTINTGSRINARSWLVVAEGTSIITTINAGYRINVGSFMDS